MMERKVLPIAIAVLLFFIASSSFVHASSEADDAVITILIYLTL